MLLTRGDRRTDIIGMKKSATPLSIGLSLVTALFTISCAGPQSTTERSVPGKSPTANTSTRPAAESSAEPNLTKLEAERRASAISDVTYRLSVDVSADGETFKGRVAIAFRAGADRSGLFLDFRNSGAIESMRVNGAPVAAERASHRILLNGPALKSGANLVEIEYSQKYSRNGRGLHRFQDSEDKRVYLFTQFETFEAHHMFPCFDQPDLKATMEMSVTAPKEWEVISTTRESAKSPTGANVVWEFPVTPRLSTYLFSLHAGPYHVWEAQAGDGLTVIPMRLFARQSLKKYVVPADWFTPTRQGLKFFGDYFDFPYPFKKYDQVIAPEFNAGAMENVAAVTFSERFVTRGQPTREDRMGLASVILHEMAHMWFGDLVTMKWWNGLWLNESFATYMAALASAEATEFKDAWVKFYARNKAGAYVEDQLVTTHPVESDIPDTSSAFANFDSITYGKGASVLKQLGFAIGAEAFRDGVRAYFKKHAYGNTRIKDFVGALERSSGRDLKEWSKQWFEMAGLDSVRADFECDKGRITRFALIHQGPSGAAPLRSHRTQIALYSDKSGRARPFQKLSVDYRDGTTAVPALTGTLCPSMVDPNDEDHDYVKVRLDARSLAFIKKSLAKIDSEFARVRIWPVLYEMVRDLELKPQDYLKAVEQNLPIETFAHAGHAMLSPIENVVYYLPQRTAAEKNARLEAVRGLERASWAKLVSAAKDSDWQKHALTAWSEISESQEARDRTVALLKRDFKLQGAPLSDPDDRWDLVIRLSSLGDRRAEALINAERNLDKSDRGISLALAAEAARPALENKKSWISRVVDKEDLSFHRKREIMWNIFPRTQDNLRAAVSSDFYSQLQGMLKVKELHFLTTYVHSLLPTVCTTESAKQVASFIKENEPKLPVPVLKALRIGHQEDTRCVAIRH